MQFVYTNYNFDYHNKGSQATQASGHGIEARFGYAAIRESQSGGLILFKNLRESDDVSLYFDHQ